MTYMVEPRRAVENDDETSRDGLEDGELTSLVRRWMAAGSKVQDRVRRESVLRIAPDPDAVEAETAETAETAEAETVEPHAYVVGTTRTAVSAPTGRIDGMPEVHLPRHEAQPQVGFPALPRRSTGADAQQVHRVALLIDARRVSADVASALLALLGERGAVNVCRAYADWNRSDLADWVSHMRKEGLHSFHHYSDDDDQALVAMTIDAVDIARDAAVDEVVIAGDLTSALPLVHRLHAAGVRVVAAGQGHTPHDVRAACHEFIDTSTIDGTPAGPQGRHRA